MGTSDLLVGSPAYPGSQQRAGIMYLTNPALPGFMRGSPSGGMPVEGSAIIPTACHPFSFSHGAYGRSAQFPTLVFDEAQLAAIYRERATEHARRAMSAGLNLDDGSSFAIKSAPDASLQQPPFVIATKTADARASLALHSAHITALQRVEAELSHQLEASEV